MKQPCADLHWINFQREALVICLASPLRLRSLFPGLPWS
jgi:hypothetical protein